LENRRAHEAPAEIKLRNRQQYVDLGLIFAWGDLHGRVGA
jgi:hypothetical protein